VNYATVTSARAILGDLLEKKATTIITKGGLPAAVLVGWEAYRRLKAIETLVQDRGRLEQLLASLRQIEATGVVSGETPLPGWETRRRLTQHERAAARVRV
jgi:prevent-host-death family protein